MKSLVVALVVCFSGLSSSAVLAETASSGKLNYVSIGVGGVWDNFLLGEELDSEVSFPGQPGRASLPDVDLTGGYVLGIRCGRLMQPPYREDITVELAAELEAFIISGTDVDDEFYGQHPFGTSVTADADISVKAIMLNFLLRYPHGSVHPYGGIGIGWAWFECDTVLKMEPGFTWPGTESGANDLGELNDDTFAGQIRLGCELDLTDVLSFDLGYRYLRIDDAELDKADFDLHMKYEVDMITFGLIYRF